MMIEDEFVRNCRNASAVRFRETCDDMEVMKCVNILRQERGNVDSEGKIGSYQYLSSQCKLKRVNHFPY